MLLLEIKHVIFTCTCVPKIFLWTHVGTLVIVEGIVIGKGLDYCNTTKSIWTVLDCMCVGYCQGGEMLRFCWSSSVLYFFKLYPMGFHLNYSSTNKFHFHFLHSVRAQAYGH